MSSPALRHRQKVLATLAGSPSPRAGEQRGRPAAPPPTPQAGGPANEYAALLAALHEDIRTLSDIQSHEQRQPRKVEMAAKYAPWIAGILEADQPVQDDVLVTNMIWALDYRDFETALTLAAFVLKHGLVLPERYSRTPACFLAEEVAELALAQHEEVAHEVLLQVASMIEGHDMPDQVTAKLKKALGRSWMRKAVAFDPAAENAPAGGALAYVEQGLADLERALVLDPQAGVKKDIQAAKSLQKKLAAAAAA